MDYDDEVGVGTDKDDAPKLKMKRLVESKNIAQLLEDGYLDSLGSQVVQDYQADRDSRMVWEQRNSEALKLALQLKEEKTFPWTGASNVKFPIVTIAALQFLSRVSILTKGRRIVQCDVIGGDPTGAESARARRISTHMSYQLVEEDTTWIDEDEKAKLTACILGCAFKKTYFDAVEGINRSEHVTAADFVVDYYTKDLNKANRVTHVVALTENEVFERVRRGLFVKCGENRRGSGSDSPPEDTLLQITSDLIQGVDRPSATDSDMLEVLEQHLWIDLDGDGYCEPYIAFVERESAKVRRIVARYFDNGDVLRVNDQQVARLLRDASTEADANVVEKLKGEAKKLQEAKDNHIVRITPVNYFTKYTFIPSPDGGFYDLGFGALLGPLNESVNTLINQLIDAGTMQNTAGGFLGRGVKLKGGRSSFDPFEWKPVDSQGDDLRKNIVPLPVRDPSAVLFQLLGMLVGYGEKISGATDIMTGMNPGQNTPAETSRNTIEQGMKLFSGIYGRMHRAFKEELRKLFRLNQLYMDFSSKFYDLTTGDGAIITLDDYKKATYKVSPSADVEIVSEEQRRQKASLVKQVCDSYPASNQWLANVRFLEANDVADIEQFLPDPKGPNAIQLPPNAKLDMENKKLQLQQMTMEGAQRTANLKLQMEMEVNQAKIEELHAQATKLLAEAQGIEVQQQISAINAQIGASRAHQDGMVAALTIMQKAVEHQHQVQQDIGAMNERRAASSIGNPRVATTPSNPNVPEGYAGQ